MRGWIFRLMALLILLGAVPAAAQSDKPLIYPLKGQPGLDTWLMGQPYGNTVGSFNFGRLWYSAGQGLHFGIDFSAPCGTELVSMADGIVRGVDNLSFGSAPHNLLIQHPQHGLSVLYGHLLDRAPLVEGQEVKQGQLVGYSGDPDLTCVSRPHLHLEVRSLDYRTTYNPVTYIDAPWHMLASIGGFQYPLFQLDLLNPRRWITLEDQPDVVFGGAVLNAYTRTYPPARGDQPPEPAPLPRTLSPLDADATVTLRRVTQDACCASPRWHPTDADTFHVMDGSSAGAYVLAFDAATGEAPQIVSDAPPPFYSSDYTHTIQRVAGVSQITRLTDNATWTVNTGGALPTLSPDNARLLWVLAEGLTAPGQDAPMTSVMVSAADGSDARQITYAAGLSARWLDADRVMLWHSADRITAVYIYNLLEDTFYELGRWQNLRGMSAAPGGGRLMFYLPFQEDPAQNGVYMIETQQGAAPVKLPWFGAWRWRDADSVFYIPFEPTQRTQELAYYHIPTGESRTLTTRDSTPFIAANGDWDVSADGRRVIFQSAEDYNVWVLEVE